MKKSYLEEVKDEPLLRRTYDSAGNVYYWQSIDAVHSTIEGFLQSKYPNYKFNQNQRFVYDEKEKNKEKLQLREDSEIRYDTIPQKSVDIKQNREYDVDKPYIDKKTGIYIDTKKNIWYEQNGIDKREIHYGENLYKAIDTDLSDSSLCSGSLNGISTMLGYPNHQEFRIEC